MVILLSLKKFRDLVFNFMGQNKIAHEDIEIIKNGSLYDLKDEKIKDKW